ncbi:MAG: hypothetical protein IBJ13_06100 [Sphingopyxis sp.]|nr:hypothetical protein [Sphingopyxis sp.]
MPPAAMARTVAPVGSLLPEDQRAFAAAVDRAIKGNRAEMQGLMQILATCSKG